MTKARREKKNRWKAIKREGRQKQTADLKLKIGKYLIDKKGSLGTSPEDVLTFKWCDEQVTKLDKMSLLEMQAFCETYIDKEVTVEKTNSNS